jgi:hypothetical protein
MTDKRWNDIIQLIVILIIIFIFAGPFFIDGIFGTKIIEVVKSNL